MVSVEGVLLLLLLTHRPALCCWHSSLAYLPTSQHACPPPFPCTLQCAAGSFAGACHCGAMPAGGRRIRSKCSRQGRLGEPGLGAAASTARLKCSWSPLPLFLSDASFTFLACAPTPIPAAYAAHVRRRQGPLQLHHPAGPGGTQFGGTVHGWQVRASCLALGSAMAFRAPGMKQVTQSQRVHHYLPNDLPTALVHSRPSAARLC